TVEVEGHQLKLSNLDKVLYPEVGFTKGQVIDYYTRVAPVLLPHLRERPLTLKRYPNGVDAPFFYEKRCPKHRPDWVRTTAVWSKRNADNLDFCLADDLATLVWVANLASLELHTSLSRGADIDRPSMMVFDLDPGAPATIVECAQVGLWLRELLDDLGLESVAKTSGSSSRCPVPPRPVGVRRHPGAGRRVAPHRHPPPRRVVGARAGGRGRPRVGPARAARQDPLRVRSGGGRRSLRAGSLLDDQLQRAGLPDRGADRGVVPRGCRAARRARPGATARPA